jgi:hypothetical protein
LNIDEMIGRITAEDIASLLTLVPFGGELASCEGYAISVAGLKLLRES